MSAKLSLLMLLALAAPAYAASLDFYRDIYPFLKANCISCHNKTTTKADLDMETPEAMKKGGESGPAIVAGKGAESLVVLASRHQEDMEMPPANNKSGAVDLTAGEIALLTQWIDEGAKSSVQQQRSITWQPLAAGVHPIYCVAVSPDGRYAACGRSDKIFIYDLATRQFVSQITDPALKGKSAHRSLIQSLAFSPDGTRLASGSFREVKVWKHALAPAPAPTSPQIAITPVAATLLKTIESAAKTNATSHAMSADGKLAAIGCADGSVRLWDVTAGKLTGEFLSTLASVQEAAALERTLATQGLETAFHKAAITKLEAQNKALDELLKKANETIVAMKKVLPEKQKAVTPATAAKAAAQKVVDETAKGQGDKPDAAKQKQLKDAQEKLLTATTAETSALAAVTAAESNIQDATEEVTRITGTKTQNATALTAAKASSDKAQKVITDATTALAALKKRTSKAVPLTVAFSADSQQVAAFFDDQSLRVWAAASGQALAESRPSPAKPQVTLQPSTDGGFIATQSLRWTAGAVPQWALERTLGGESDPQLFVDRVNAVRFSPDGKILATGGGELSRSGDIILFDTATGKVTTTWKDRHEDAVLSLDFSPDGKRIASGSSDKLAKVTDITTGRQTNLFEGHTHYVSSVSFRADGRVLATAGADGVVMTWDVLSGERKKKIEGWTKEVTSVQFIGATSQLLTSAGDNLVRIVTDEGGQVRSITGLPDFMQAATTTPAGQVYVGGGEDSYLRIWDGATGKELASFGPPSP